MFSSTPCLGLYGGKKRRETESMERCEEQEVRGPGPATAGGSQLPTKFFSLQKMRFFFKTWRPVPYKKPVNSPLWKQSQADQAPGGGEK